MGIGTDIGGKMIPGFPIVSSFIHSFIHYFTTSLFHSFVYNCMVHSVIASSTRADHIW